MTTSHTLGRTTTNPRPQTSTPRRDLRRVERIVAAVLMPIGPALTAILRVMYPPDPLAASVAADPDAFRFVAHLGNIAWLFLIPGAYAALHLVRRHAPRLTAWAAALLIPGYLGMAALGTDSLVLVATDMGVDPAFTDALLDGLFAEPSSSSMVWLFVVGHIAGTVLLGSAMLAGRVSPVVAGVAMVVSQPLHLTAVIIGSPALDLVGWGLTAVGMGFLAWVALHTSDDDWDLPPLPRPQRSGRMARPVG